MNRLVVWHRWLPPRQDADTPVETIREWLRTLAGRLQVMGGDVLGPIGAATAATFELSDAVDVIEMGLEILEEAEAEGLAVSLAVTAGRVLEADDAPLISEALERAQLLANRARPGELVLGPSAKDLVTDAFLFGRRVNAGAGAPRGITIDREHAHRDDQSSQAIRELGPPPVPPALQKVVVAASRALDEGHRSLAFRGPVGAGASEVIAELARKRGGVPWRLAPALGGLVPLASLRAALLRRFTDPAGVTRAFEAVDSAGVFTRVAEGALVPRAALTRGLRSFLDSEKEAGRTPWLVMSPLGQIDGATLEAILPVHDDGASILATRLGLDAEIPRPLREGREMLELTLPPLKMADALKVAEGALGADTSADVARRVAVLGGDTVLGILDAARALIASGDLVHADEGFVWRKGPVEGAAALDGGAILEARLEPLDETARRVLEALCVLPEGSSRALLSRVAAAHGVDERGLSEGMQALLEGALARDEAHPRPSSPWVRWRVLGRMDAERSSKLNEGVAAALSEDDGVPTALTRAYYLHEAGRDDEARAIVDDAISDIVAADYHRSARQLMGWLETWTTDSAHRRAAVGFEPDEDGPPTREVPLAPIAGEDFEGGDEEATVIGSPAAPEAPARPAPETLEPTVCKPNVTPSSAPPSSVVPPRAVAAPSSPPPSEIPDPSLDLDEDPTRVASLADPAYQAALAPRQEASLEEELDALLEEEPEVDMSATAEIEGVVSDPNAPSVAEAWLDDTDNNVSDAPPAASRPPPLPRRRPEAAPAEVTSISSPPPLPPREERSPFDAETTMPHAVAEAAPAEVPEDDGKTRVGPLPTLSHGVHQALRARDFEALDALLADAGTERPALHRVRAVARLLRGDLKGARHDLVHAPHDDNATRTKVLRALIELCAGDPALGARVSLDALAAARRIGDRRGEWVSRQVLAECLSSLGFDEAAERARPEMT